MSLAAKLRPSVPAATVDPRRSERTRMLLDAGARQGEGAFDDIRVHDLSADGFRAEMPLALDAGTEVEIDLPGIGVRAARVMWAGPPYAGCAFAESLDADALRAALAESPVVWGDFGDGAVEEPPLARGAEAYFEAALSGAGLTRPVAADAVAAAEEPYVHELPVRTRFLSIVGLAGGLWAMLIGGGWVLFG